MASDSGSCVSDLDVPGPPEDTARPSYQFKQSAPLKKLKFLGKSNLTVNNGISRFMDPFRPSRSEADRKVVLVSGLMIPQLKGVESGGRTSPTTVVASLLLQPARRVRQIGHLRALGSY